MRSSTIQKAFLVIELCCTCPFQISLKRYKRRQKSYLSIVELVDYIQKKNAEFTKASRISFLDRPYVVANLPFTVTKCILTTGT